MDQRSYEMNELRQFHKQLEYVEKAPLSERKEACREFHEAMVKYPELVGERIGWLLDGNYGFGSYQAAHRIVKSPRMNRVAALTQIIAALEWQCPNAMARAAWKKLSKAEQAHLDKVIRHEIEHSAKETAGSPRRVSRRRRTRRSPSKSEGNRPPWPGASSVYSYLYRVLEKRSNEAYLQRKEAGWHRKKTKADKARDRIVSDEFRDVISALNKGDEETLKAIQMHYRQMGY